MSYHFNAGQFEKPFLPKHLGNWEVPHWYPKKPKPTAARGSTIPIAEPRGRLLPRVHRAAPAWGYRRTAWDYPNRITRQLADELSKDPPVERYADYNSQSNEIRKNKPPPDDISIVEKFKDGDVKDHVNTEGQADKDPDDDYIHGPIEALNLNDIDNLKDVTLENIDDSIADEMNKHSTKSKTDALKHKCRSLPIVDPFSGFHYARKMHMDNLLHHPLPDTMGSKDTHAQHIPGRDLIVKPYASEWKGPSHSNERRPLTCNRTHKTNVDTSRPATSGGEKENKLKYLSPMDLAICWDFRTANPRDEPKRPKHIDGSNGSLAPAVFSMVHSPKQNTLNIPETGRSNAIFSQNILPADFEDDRILPSFDKDMSKDKRKNACDVPKCAQHSCFEKKIHKNNGTKSSSEKSLKKNGHKNKIECDGIHGCGTIETPSSHASKTSATRHHHKIKNAWEETKENHSPDSKKNGHLERSGSLDHLNNNCANSVQSLNEQNKIYRSSPNIYKQNGKDEDVSSCTESCLKNRSRNNYNRDCKACDDNKSKVNNVASKAEYKMAFKAGKPNSTGSSDSKNGDVSTTITTTTKNSLKIPKMRDPYSKKSYAIPTLTPPFSRWHDTSGYPEHWRLASVYQHAYKPPGPKRRPLLPAVFK